MAESPKEREALFKDLSRAWYIGSSEGKQTLRDQIEQGGAKANAEARKRLETLRIGELPADCLKQLGKGPEAIEADTKSAECKWAIASYLKSTASVKNPQLCAFLNPGHPSTMSTHVSAYSRSRKRKCPFARQLQLFNNQVRPLPSYIAVSKLFLNRANVVIGLP